MFASVVVASACANHLRFYFGAFFAILLRCSLDNALALSFPPFNQPSRPSSTAAGFLAGSGSSKRGLGFSPVTSWGMRNADWLLSSRLLDRFGITVCYRVRKGASLRSPFRQIQTETLRASRLCVLDLPCNTRIHREATCIECEQDDKCEQEN